MKTLPSPGLGKPCDLIFHQQPGLIPFKTSKLGEEVWYNRPGLDGLLKENARNMVPEITLNRIIHRHQRYSATDDPESPEDRRLYPWLLSKWWTQLLQWQFHGLCSRAWTTPTASWWQTLPSHFFYWIRGKARSVYKMWTAHNCTYGALIIGSIVSMGLEVIFLRYMYILECMETSWDLSVCSGLAPSGSQEHWSYILLDAILD